jgi:hypothetical protein
VYDNNEILVERARIEHSFVRRISSCLHMVMGE